MQHLIILAVLAGCSRAPSTCPPHTPATAPSAKPAASDLVIARSAHDHAETLSRAVTAIESRGFAIVQRVDHAAAAATAGLELPPSTVLVFGNPKAGTPLMLLAPSLALDLPLRLLVWKTGDVVQVAYRAPSPMVETHGIAQHAIVTKMTEALAAIVSDATR